MNTIVLPANGLSAAAGKLRGSSRARQNWADALTVARIGGPAAGQDQSSDMSFWPGQLAGSGGAEKVCHGPYNGTVCNTWEGLLSRVTHSTLDLGLGTCRDIGGLV